MLTGTVGRASKRSLIVRFTVSGRVPCSGAKRRGKGLDVVSTAIPGCAAAWNPQITGSKKQSDEERGAALFAVRVHLPCYV